LSTISDSKNCELRTFFFKCVTFKHLMDVASIPYRQ